VYVIRDATSGLSPSLLSRTAMIMRPFSLLMTPTSVPLVNPRDSRRFFSASGKNNCPMRAFAPTGTLFNVG
jgi:hypothetical protein